MGMFVRFVVAEKHPDTAMSAGVFAPAYRLLRSNDISASVAIELDDLLVWFDKNLKKPDRFNRSKSKGSYRRANKSISWFKDSANDHISRLRKIASILEAAGYEVTMQKTARPGYIVYEDDAQVVAEPFRELRG